MTSADSEEQRNLNKITVQRPLPALFRGLTGSGKTTELEMFDPVILHS
jgi:signal recognition particle GTPase